MKLGEKKERVKLDQHIEADLAMDTETSGGSEEFSARAKLNCVRSESKVGFAAQPRVVAGREVDCDAFQFGEVRRRIESRMQTTDSEGEVWRRLPVQTHGHVAGQGKLVQQARITQCGVEGGGTLIEVEHADGVHLQAHELTIGTRQDGKNLRENEQASSGA